jgi:hypothetical protein
VRAIRQRPRPEVRVWGFGPVVLGDTSLNYYISNVLKLPTDKRDEYLTQVDYLIARLRRKIDEDSDLAIGRFTKCGSLMKGTSLKPRDGFPADADVAVEVFVSEAEAQDIALLHGYLLELLTRVYPQKEQQDFTLQPRTLGVVFRASGLEVDLVPVVPVLGKRGYAWQHSNRGDDPVMTCISCQLDFVSGRAKADPRFKRLVRLLKRWRNYQGHEFFGSFAIELLVAYLQDTQGPAESLEEGVLRFFLYVAQSRLQEFVTFPEIGKPSSLPEDAVVIIDPVNAHNNVTRRMSDAERIALTSTASEAWEALMDVSYGNRPKGETVDRWKEIFGTSFRIED